MTPMGRFERSREAPRIGAVSQKSSKTISDHTLRLDARIRTSGFVSQDARFNAARNGACFGTCPLRLAGLAATMLAESSLNPKALQGLLGRADTRTTQDLYS